MEIEYVWVTAADGIFLGGKLGEKNSKSALCNEFVTFLDTVVPSSNNLTLNRQSHSCRRHTWHTFLFDIVLNWLFLNWCTFLLCHCGHSKDFMLKPFFFCFHHVSSYFHTSVPPVLLNSEQRYLTHCCSSGTTPLIMGLSWSFDKHSFSCLCCTCDILLVLEITGVALCFSLCRWVCSKVQERIIMTGWHEKICSLQLQCTETFFLV